MKVTGSGLQACGLISVSPQIFLSSSMSIDMWRLTHLIAQWIFSLWIKWREQKLNQHICTQCQDLEYAYQLCVWLYGCMIFLQGHITGMPDLQQVYELGNRSSEIYCVLLVLRICRSIWTADSSTVEIWNVEWARFEELQYPELHFAQ